MQNTGDAAEYRRLSRDCSNCQKYAAKIEEIYAAGGYVKTNGWQIRSVSVGSLTQQGGIDVTISIDAPRTEYVEEAGGPVEHFAGGHVDYIISLALNDGSWTTTRFAQVAH